ncbi:MAG TPA: hypothetical protein PKN27_09250 [Propionibacteriaceae bacterium]|mgnify:CR=1|nr:hypothetical protein [Propionibacteriaceae bacterium]
MKRSLATLSVAALLLAGCATGSPSTAAVVNGTPVAESQVSRWAEGCAPAFQVSASAARASMVNASVQGALADSIAAEQGIAMTEADRVKGISSMSDVDALIADPDCAEAVKAVSSLLFVADKLGTEGFTAAVRAADVRVNPRYGTWDPSAVGLSGKSGSLSATDTDFQVVGG